MNSSTPGGQPFNQLPRSGGLIALVVLLGEVDLPVATAGTGQARLLSTVIIVVVATYVLVGVLEALVEICCDLFDRIGNHTARLLNALSSARDRIREAWRRLRNRP